MKFGRGRKNSASPTSIISRVFPVSWLSRFRRPKDSRSSISEMTNSVSRNNKHIGEWHNFPAPKMSLPDGTFCSVDQVEDDGAFWRISFSRDGRIQQGRRSTGGINPLWYDAESDPEFEFPVSSFKSLDFGFRDNDDVSRERGACPKFSGMVSDIKKTKERLEFPTQLRDAATIRSSNDRIGQEDSNSIKLRYRIAREKEKQLAEFDDGKIRASTLGERDIFPVEFDNKAQKQGHVWKPAHSTARKHPQLPNIHLTPVQEIKVKPAESHGSRRIQNKSRGKAYSPRSQIKIRALEDMKKARTNSGTKGQEVIKGKTVFDSFAVAKSSFNPQKDFRDSMVQMIREKGIWRSEDLEVLLASYLTMNRDEYHDLIVKVFRQVWFEIGGEWHGRRCFDY